MTDKPRDHTESVGGASAPSPFDQPTERFPVQSMRPSNPTKPLVPQTDEDLDFGALNADSLPTEQIPTFRSGSAPAAPIVVEDQPTEVIDRGEPTVSTPLPTEILMAEPIVSEPLVSEPIGSPPAVAGPVAVPAASSPDDSRRGTLDLGLLVLRLALGGTMLVHGLQKLTGWWNGPGLGGYRDQLIDGGFDHARALAAAGAVGEVAGGALLILGLITPVAAAVVLAVMIDAWCLKQSMVPGLQYFGPEGVEYETMLGAAAAAIILTGPGRISLDGRRKWATRPYVGSSVILLLGIAVGVVVWFVLNGANPVI